MNNSNFLENYEQYKNNKNFIESDNFEEKIKSMVFTVLEDKSDNNENTETEKNIEYFSTEEVLEKLNESIIDVLFYIDDNPESIKKIDDEDLKEILLFFSKHINFHGTPVAVNFCYDIFHEKWNYEELKNNLKGDVLSLIEMLIDHYSNKRYKIIELNNNDFLYYKYLIDNNVINAQIEEDWWNRYLRIEAISVMWILSKKLMSALIQIPELFWDKEKHWKFLEALKYSDKNLEKDINDEDVFKIIWNWLWKEWIDFMKFVLRNKDKGAIVGFINSIEHNKGFRDITKIVLNSFGWKLYQVVNSNNIEQLIKEVIKIDNIVWGQLNRSRIN